VVEELVMWDWDARVAIKASSVRPELIRGIKRPSHRFLEALLRFPLPKDPLLPQHDCCSRKYLILNCSLVKSLI